MNEGFMIHINFLNIEDLIEMNITT
jgi:hypothetical protein